LLLGNCFNLNGCFLTITNKDGIISAMFIYYQILIVIFLYLRFFDDKI